MKALEAADAGMRPMWGAFSQLVHLAVPNRGVGHAVFDLSNDQDCLILEESHKVMLCHFVRDIFGNPFRPATFNPAWRTDTAVALARQMYDSRDFGAMPILADALQDAGCGDEQVLAHCRGAGPHVRGCWVVDLVLGKQ
jgi:hypothetical protein